MAIIFTIPRLFTEVGNTQTATEYKLMKANDIAFSINFSTRKPAVYYGPVLYPFLVILELPVAFYIVTGILAPLLIFTKVQRI
jgi:hypothetical protein